MHGPFRILYYIHFDTEDVITVTKWTITQLLLDLQNATSVVLRLILSCIFSEHMNERTYILGGIYNQHFHRSECAKNTCYKGLESLHILSDVHNLLNSLQLPCLSSERTLIAPCHDAVATMHILIDSLPESCTMHWTFLVWQEWSYVARLWMW